MEKTIEWVNVKNREPKLGGYYFCKIDTKQDCIVEGIVEYFKYPNGNMDWDLGDSLTHTNLDVNAEVVGWLDEKQIDDNLNIVLDNKHEFDTKIGYADTVYGHCPHGENMVTCHECNDRPMKITMDLPYVYFLEEPDKGWISKQWMMATIETFGKSALAPFTWNPLEAIACFSKTSACDLHTLLRHYQWYSNDTLKVTEHEFISTLP